MKGKRFRASRELLTSNAMSRDLTYLAIVIEPIRYITGWFVRRAREQEDVCCSPPVLDMVNPAFSPIQFALQYFGSLLTGQPGRLRLVWGTCSESYAQWCSECPQEVRRLRRLILAGAAGVYHRHSRYLKGFPFKIFKAIYKIYYLINYINLHTVCIKYIILNIVFNATPQTPARHQHKKIRTNEKPTQ